MESGSKYQRPLDYQIRKLGDPCGIYYGFQTEYLVFRHLTIGSGGGGLALSSRNTDVGFGSGGGSDGGETAPTSRRKTFLGWGSSDLAINADDTSRLLRWSRNTATVFSIHSLFSRPNVTLKYILSSIQLSKDE